MALQTSGTICISDLKTEFGSTANCLTSYYRGGSIVPNISTNNGIPTSGTICLTDFYGATALGDTTSANWFYADNQDEVSQGSVTAESYVRVEAYYTDFTYQSINVVADVNAVGGTYQEELWSANGGTTTATIATLPNPVYSIDGIGSLGYTVRYSASNFTGDASTDFNFDTQYGSLSSLTTSAQSLYVLTASPGSRRGLETRLTVTSGDGDETQAAGTCQIQLIFERSSYPTFTYTFTVDLQAEAISLGGQ